MRICNGVAGHAVEVDEAELQWKKPMDLVKQHALERWDISASDQIALSGDGGTVGPDTELLQRDMDVFVFLRSALDPSSEVAAETLSLSDPSELGVQSGSVAAPNQEDELLRLKAEFTDPAFEVFRSNIEEARGWLLEARPVKALAADVASRLEVQRLAAKAVLANLTSQRATCSRSLTLFLQKYIKVQERFDQNLSNVEPCMAALAAVPLHPAMSSSGSATLSDLVPRERISRFATDLQAERKRLAQRVDKLKQQDTSVQQLCEQVKEHMLQFAQEDAVQSVAENIQSEYAQAEVNLLTELRSLVPSAGAAPSSVLEEEKRSAGVLEGLARLCSSIRVQQLPEMQDRWKQRHAGFLQRLREVSYVQSKLRDVERQAALLEEEINVQRNYTQQLGHLKKMPRAYQKMLYEVARRRQFQDRYLAEREQARLRLARMAEEENSRRRAFLQRHGCHLPAELAQRLGSLVVPQVTVEVKSFDTNLPDIDFKSLLDCDAGTATAHSAHSESARSSAPDSSEKRAVAMPPPPMTKRGQGGLDGVSHDRGPASSTSSCASSPLQKWVDKGVGSTSSGGRSAQPTPQQSSDRSAQGDAQVGGSQGGSSGPGGTGSSGQANSILATSQDGGTGTIGSSQSLEGTSAGCAGTSSMLESLPKTGEASGLEAQNLELSAQVASLMEELAQLRAAATSQPQLETTTKEPLP